MTTIIFSKDRALQLEALLRSRSKFVEPVGDTLSLCAWSSPEHEASYDELFAMRDADDVHLVYQRDFKSDLLGILAERNGDVICLVDDLVFIRQWNGRAQPGFSLRLAPHLVRCYPLDKPQAVPELKEGGGLLSWRWMDGDGDWGYPLSLDGTTFDIEEFRSMVERVEFNSPNSLEAALQAYAPLFGPRIGTCRRLSTVVNVPWTLVQGDWQNRNAGLDANDLLKAWQAGQRIDLSDIYGAINESAHQEFPLKLEPRC